MNIVPSGDPRRQAALEAARMARVDGCEKCVSNYETPVRVRPARAGFRADYYCHHCHHEWTTWWADEQPDWMM